MRLTPLLLLFTAGVYYDLSRDDTFCCILRAGKTICMLNVSVEITGQFTSAPMFPCGSGLAAAGCLKMILQRYGNPISGFFKL